MRIRLSGAVLEPSSGAFDVTVAPGEGVQAAVDACPRGGSVLLLPGTHAGPLVLSADQEVHVFGRGSATLRTVAESAAGAYILISDAAVSTLDGLALQRRAGGAFNNFSVWIKGGRVRLQACILSNSRPRGCVRIDGGADPTLSFCKYVRPSGPGASLLSTLCPPLMLY